MAAGYSNTPLFKKLGLKDGCTIKTIHAPAHYKELLGDASERISFKPQATKDLDVIHFFTNSENELNSILPKLMQQISKSGSIWVSWYKKASGKATELNDNILREAALAIGLVDVKVCAVDEDWSGLKLVYRLKDR